MIIGNLNTKNNIRKIEVIWIENKNVNFYNNIIICKKLFILYLV